MLFHGEIDHLVPADQSRLLLTALQSENVAARLQLYPNDGHVFTPMHMLDALQQTVAFFDENLKSVSTD